MKFALNAGGGVLRTVYKFSFKMMNFVSKMMNFVSKMMNFALMMMDFCI